MSLAGLAEKEDEPPSEASAALRVQCRQLQQSKSVVEAQLAKALEANEQLRKEVEQLRERCAQKCELADEMKAGWAFESTELRAGNEELKAEVSRLTEAAAVLRERNEILFDTVMSFFPSVESEARAVIEREEGRFTLPPTLTMVRKECLPIPTNGHMAKGKALYRLYEHVKNHTVSAAVAGELLGGEAGVTSLSFIPEGGSGVWGGAFPIPQDDLVPFLQTVVCPLPALEKVDLYFFPSMSECVLPWVGEMQPRFTQLKVRCTPFTVADLRTIVQRCQGLVKLAVSFDYCTDWEDFEDEDDEDERKEAVNDVCEGIVRWR